ncbi:hypothetical protein BT69DRAFT_1318133 [Atractiella rhizophila]|nr:hypothetical protein BT69DRAFT_1318133 [Atractiella rhizophila]
MLSIPRPLLPLLLLIQNSSISLLTSHSLHATSYDPRTAVLVTEVVKLLFSLAMELSVSGTPPWKVIRQLKGGEVGMMCVPSLLYTLQAVTEEMVRFLLLVVGVALVQLDDGAGGKSGLGNEGEDKVRGLLAIGAASVTSGVAGCWFESLLKRSPPTPAKVEGTKEREEREKGMKNDTLWTKNVSLALPSIAFAASPLLGSPTSYTPLVWGVILLQSLGGILVSLVVRDFSSVTKGFVTSGSIVLTSSGGMYLYALRPGLRWYFGAMAVIGATGVWSLG